MIFNLLFVLLIFAGLFIYAMALEKVRELRIRRIDDDFEQLPWQDWISKQAKIRYFVQGQGNKNIVLLHGLGASSYCWRLLWPLLATRYRVITFDLPGFGRSRLHSHPMTLDSLSAEIHNFLTSQNFTPSVLVGSSLGGLLALWLGRTYPDHYPQVVALAPAAHPSLVPIRMNWLAKLNPLRRLLLAEWMVGVGVRRVLHNKLSINSQQVLRYAEPYFFNPDTWRAFFHSTEILRDIRLPFYLKDLKLPTLILWGECDLMVKRHQLDGLLQVLPNFELHTSPESGHHIQEDNPSWVSSQIFTFLDSTK